MEARIVHASSMESAKLHILAFVYGFFVVIRRMLKWAWDPKKFFVLRQRDKPPPCLVDNTFGTHSYVKLKGIKFHYVEAGKKDRPLVLLLHGFPDCWLSWREQIQVLSEYFWVVAIDLKGFGDSDKPSNRSAYRIEILIDELKQVILALGVKTCSIIGHDLGGLLGWYMVALHEDMINKFVAISSPHPNLYWSGKSDDTIFNKKWIHFSRLPFLPEIDALKEDLSIINETFKHLKTTEKSNEKEYIEAYKYTFSRKEDWTGPINYYRNLPYTKLESNNSESIYTRTLFVNGNNDPSVSLEDIVHSCEYVEKFTVKVIPGARHFPHQEKPELVNEIIIKFLVGTQHNAEKPQSRSMVSSWLGSFSTTMKYGNQVLDAVQKRTNGVVNHFPTKVLYLGHTNAQT